jgi:hypothetical protein
MKKLTNTEKYLYRFFDIGKEIQQLKNARADIIREVDDHRNTLFTPVLKNEGRDDSHRIKNPVLEAVIKIQDDLVKKIEKMTEEIRGLETEKMLIEQTVKAAGLTGVEAGYIRARFFECRGAWQTANRIGYSERGAYRYKVSALAKIRKMRADSGRLAVLV